MKVSLRLKKLLGEYGLDRHGVIQHMAADMGVDRHTVAKVYGDRCPTLSLKLMSRLCSWLQDHGIPAGDLPGALFSTGWAPLWDAIARKHGDVQLFLGEYQSARRPSLASRWIASCDAAVAARLLQQLSAGGEPGSPGPCIRLRHVPFSYNPDDPTVPEHPLAEDIARSQAMFQALRTQTHGTSTIIIGSQRVNYLLEHFIADLFGCRPFTETPNEPAVPFYSVYRGTDQHTPSCFGGSANPYRRRDRGVAGLHVRNAAGHWDTLPWKRDRSDAGIILTLREQRRKAITLVAFGFSGWATEAVGEQLVLREDRFWPPSVELKGREVGIYVCRFTCVPPAEGREAPPLQCEVTPMSEHTLRRFLR